MRVRPAIVVRWAQTHGGYRDGDRGTALILEQIATSPRGDATLLASSFTGVASASATAFASDSPFWSVLALGAGALLGAGIGALVDRARARAVAKVRLVVADRELRVFRPGDAPEPAARVPVTALERIELLPLDIEGDGWSLVALASGGLRVPMLETGDRTAGLRARTLILERLVRDGAFEGEDLASIACPCGARIVAPHRWLPTSIACGRCGAEGMLARAA